VISTATNRVIGKINVSTIAQAFAINGAETLMISNTRGFPGFDEEVLSNGVQRSLTVVPTGTSHHGIGFRPDEKEIWVSGDGSNLYEEDVFDNTVSPPRLKRRLTLPYTHSQHRPQWVTFTIDGRFAYVPSSDFTSDVTPVFSTSSYAEVGNVGISECLLEVDIANRAISAVGNQFGIGRVP
jgi:hypothetical protein